MLNNIRLHLEKDEEKQLLLEKKLSDFISDTHKKNVNSFRRQIPSLITYINSPGLKNISVFCNKHGEINIVDYGRGRTLYGLHPAKDVQAQCERFFRHSAYINVNSDSTSMRSSDVDRPSAPYGKIGDIPTYNQYQMSPAFPENVDCLVVLGCGLGSHIEALLAKATIKHLIIYEPESQYFRCSINATDWHNILDVAREKGTALYFQIEKDGRNIIHDIIELKQHYQIPGFHLYKHYNHPVFDSIYHQLTTQPWEKLKLNGLNFVMSEDYLDYCPTWTPAARIDNSSDVKTTDTLFKNNLTALKRYYPEIHKQFCDYQPRKWQPFKTTNEQINLLKHNNLVTLYSDDPKEDCLQNYNGFAQQPNKDGLILGYEGKKLANYLHYKFVKQTQNLLNDLTEEIGALPEHVQSIIIFGIGVGYQLESLHEKHTFEHLFICEPNPDFFYASLFAIDWNAIFEQIEEQDARLYLNIGDDGTNLFEDLISQFHAIGPYLLSNTYFYQSYYNASLNSAIAQLREMLQIVISMGEYFDHAYYGINHTKTAIAREYPLLNNAPRKRLSAEDRQVPIFLVGNGPSLDASIETLKEWQDKAIIVSCGTSLKPLYRNGIKPDFQAEIEQNRTTYDWSVLVNDSKYLKGIDLLSCNGIHPDTCNLYRNTYISFKEGESSTVSALTILDRQKHTVLDFAFPTVSNFAFNLFSEMGFENIYLVGIDLGFADQNHHHSINSNYYKQDGTPLYDYAAHNNSSKVVAGNFRQTVYTKHEFDVARQVIEDTIKKCQNELTIYNCSDGARIAGTQPLLLDNILIVTSAEAKQTALRSIKEKAYTPKAGDSFISQFDAKFSAAALASDLSNFDQLIQQKITDFEDAEALIKKQKELLFSSYTNGNSLLFFYFYGTVNYANSLFSKIIYSSLSKNTLPKRFSESLQMWQTAFSEMKNLALSKINYLDSSQFLLNDRENLLVAAKMDNDSIHVITNSQAFADSVKYWIKQEEWNVNLHFTNIKELNSTKSISEHVIYHYNPDISDSDIIEKLYNGESLPIKGTKRTMLIVNHRDVNKIRELAHLNNDFLYLATEFPNRKLASSRWRSDEIYTAFTVVKALLAPTNSQLILHKYIVTDDYQNDRNSLFKLQEDDLVFDFHWYLSVTLDSTSVQDPVTLGGTRAKYIRDQSDIETRIYTTVSKEENQDIQKILYSRIPALYDDTELN